MKKKYIFLIVLFFVVIFFVCTWWWHRPSNVIFNVSNVKIPFLSKLLYEKVEDLGQDFRKIYVLQVDSAFVEKMVSSCGMHNGELVNINDTSAVFLKEDPDFEGHEFLSKDIGGCYIVTDDKLIRWEMFLSEDLLYFQYIIF